MTEEENKTNQFLTFIIDDGLYAIDVTSIREVLDYSKITKIPKTSRFYKGVINLRGKVIPVADLRVRFDMPEIESDVNTSIIVIELKIDTSLIVIGILVDSVQEVINLPSHDMVPAPSMGSRVDSAFIDGVGKKDDDFIIILNMNKIFGGTAFIEEQEDNVIDEESEEEESMVYK